MKFGRIKRQHGRIDGLDKILDKIDSDCPYVSRMVPGRIRVRRGRTASRLRIQYPTGAGLKCIYAGAGAVQEIFLICTNVAKARQWLIESGIAEADAAAAEAEDE
jgi:hypothetical protein